MKSGVGAFRRALLTTIGCAMVFTPILAGAQNRGAPPGPPPVPNYNVPPNDRPTAYGLNYGRPFIDVDEWRDKPRRHRYVHGGFDNSHLRFSIYMPPKELYKKRFLLMLEGGTGGSDKMMATGGGGEHESWDFAFDVAFDRLGAYMVETNEGHFPDEGLGTDTPEVLWGASGYGTSYVRNIAAQMYGAKPAYGYVQGCSGGGTRSSRHVENLPDLINGSVSQAWGHLGLEQWSVYGLASRLIGKQMEGVKDALDTGGDGNPFKGLDKRQAAALKDLLDMGMIREGVFQYKTTGWSTTQVQLYHIRDTDPTYFKDFWTKPGYLGHDDPKSIADLVVDEDVAVTKTFATGGASTTAQVQSGIGAVGAYGPSGSDAVHKRTAVLDYKGDPERLMHASIEILSGPDKGKDMIIGGVGGGGERYRVSPFTPRAPYAFDNVNVGDKVHLTNRDLIAYLYYYRYHGEMTTKLLGLQTAKYKQAFPEFRAVMNPDGSSKYVQRQGEPDYKPQSANFKGKIIAVSGEADEAIWPTSMNSYVRRVKNNLGKNVDNQFRMYWLDDHSHCGGRLTGPISTVAVPAEGFTQQALVDLANWVEKGVAPPASNPYTFSPNNKILISDNAKIKRGTQPVAKLMAPGAKNDRLEVKAGTTVTFTGSAEVPPGAGYIVLGDFDFEGQGTWPEKVKNINGTSPTVKATATYTYSKPGTYFATFRAGSHRQGSKMIKGDLPIYDVARMRIVVN